MTDIQNKKQILESVMKKIKKEFGDGAIMTLGQRTHMDIATVSTGCLSLDLAIGVGGLPKGRIIEIYGPESSGKTTFALGFVASCQKAGGTAAFIDAEHALDPAYAKRLGVDIDNLLIAQPDNGEQALEIVDNLISCGSVNIIIIDSVAALVPKAELDGDMEQSSVGVQARLMSKVLRKITGSTARTGCIVVFINQIRMKIGTAAMYGSPETTTGGNALKFYASIRIEVRKGKTISKNEKAIGAETKLKIVKNKVSPPFKEVMVDLIFGEGIPKEAEIVNLAENLGILEKAGSWYSYKGERLSQGKDNLKDYLKVNPTLAIELEKEIRKVSFTSNSSLEPKESQNNEE
jgi:recombination protein RecA